MQKPKHPREWEESAVCHGHDGKPEVEALLDDLGELGKSYGLTRPGSVTELFFPPRVRELYHVYADRAKDYCMGKDRRRYCPVRRECLIWAIHTDQEHGIFGGMSHRERNALKRKAERAGEDFVEYIYRTMDR